MRATPEAPGLTFDEHGQWLPGPGAPLVTMAQAVAPGGLVVLRDYAHTVEQPFGDDVVEDVL